MLAIENHVAHFAERAWFDTLTAPRKLGHVAIYKSLALKRSPFGPEFAKPDFWFAHFVLPVGGAECAWLATGI